MKKILPFIVVFLLVGLSGQINAQGFPKKNRYTSIGVNINAMNYVGDEDPGPSFISPGLKFTRPNIGIEYIYRFAPRVSFRGNISDGEIGGSDQKNADYSEKNIFRKIRNEDFKSNIFEAKADVIIDLFENRGKYTKRPDYTPYIAVGLAYFHMNPKGQINNSGQWYALEPQKLEGQSFSLNQIAIPLALGFRYKLSKQWDLSFEIGWRKTFTGYLDGVSSKYYDPSALGAATNSTTYQLANQTLAAYNSDPTLKSFIDSHYGNGQAGSGLVPVLNPNGTPVVNGNGQTVMTVRGFGNSGDQRGTPRTDVYILTGFHLTYIIPGRIICPKFR